jgi:hypothetical protein
MLPHYCQKISLHQLEYEVEIELVRGSNNSVQFDYVWMVDLFQYLNFAVSALSVDVIAKGSKHFFKSDKLPIGFVLGFPDMAVCSTSYQISNFVHLKDVSIYFFRHLNYK